MKISKSQEARSWRITGNRSLFEVDKDSQRKFKGFVVHVLQNDLRVAEIPIYRPPYIYKIRSKQKKIS